MPSNDGTVVQENVAKIVCHIRRIGWEVVFDDLADKEPALAGYAMAAADMLSHRLQKEGVPYDLVLLIAKEMMTAQRMHRIDATGEPRIVAGLFAGRVSKEY